MRGFVLQATVIANVIELRKALGSVSKPLSLRDFAALVERSHPSKKVSANMVQRWEDGWEPDVMSIAIMAQLAGVSFEEFALGKGATWQTVADGPGVSLRVAEPGPRAAGEKVADPAPHPDRAGARPTKRRQGRG